MNVLEQYVHNENEVYVLEIKYGCGREGNNKYYIYNTLNKAKRDMIALFNLETKYYDEELDDVEFDEGETYMSMVFLDSLHSIDFKIVKKKVIS